MSPNNSLNAEELAFLPAKTWTARRDGKARRGHQVLARESFEGTVLEVTGEDVLVQYDTGDDLVEQCYRKDQFQLGKVPAVGDRIAVDVVVRTLAPLKESMCAGEGDEYKRKNVVSGDFRF